MYTDTDGTGAVWRSVSVILGTEENPIPLNGYINDINKANQTGYYIIGGVGSPQIVNTPTARRIITTNDTHDVSDCASVVVNVRQPDEEDFLIEANGEYDVEWYKNVIVAVLEASDSALPVEIKTESEMTAILTAATSEDNGKIYKYVGEAGTYTQNAYYKLEATADATITEGGV